LRAFDHSDELSLQAALGWLELGDWREANTELENIQPALRGHPDVLQVRLKIYCKAEKWDYAAEIANALCRMLPETAFGPLHLAYTLRKLERVADAQAALLPIADKFPDDWRIAFSLACYSCRLGNLRDALRWIDYAIDLAGKLDIRMKALDEKDLEPLWLNISEI
jgi:predicted Zn-dependent protease